jgi:hypothetical protein
VVFDDAPDEEKVPPQISVLSPQPGGYLSQSPVVSGLVTGQSAISTVTVNDLTAETTGLGTPYVSFQAALAFPAGQSDATIEVTATDTDNQSATVSLVVYLDDTPPAISLSDAGLQAPPAVNSITETPYRVAGSVTEANPAGLYINDQPVALTPSGAGETYDFEVSIGLTYEEPQQIVLSAWDLAGNHTGTEWIVRLDSNLAIEVIAPADGAELQGQGDAIDVGVTVRVAGAGADDLFVAAIDGGAPVTLARSGYAGNGTLNLPLTQDDHSLSIEVQNSVGAAIARTTTGFTTRNMDNVPLAVERHSPENGATGIEPNEFIALYFNKAIDPSLLSIQVLETAHGETYAAPASGAGLSELSKVELIEVHRDREPVPGGISHVPGNKMAAFYAQRDLAYGADVFVTATYDGAELVRTTYKVRELPTFIEGFVLNTNSEPLGQIDLAISSLGLECRTDREGAFGFGFKMPADQNIPGGRHKLVVNPGMKNPRFGTVEQWVNTKQGRLNAIGAIRLPAINPNIPFRRITSAAEAILAGGALKLDLTRAALSFADLRGQGDVHVQVLQLHELSHGFSPYAAPQWVFAVQPAGIEVSGNVDMTMAVPAIQDGYDYLDNWSEYVVLLGFDANSLTLAPAGVGKLDRTSNTVSSQKSVALQRLDYIGYALMPYQCEPYLEEYLDGGIDLNQLIEAIETQQ